jgi:AraC-like DNA-binding protein
MSDARNRTPRKTQSSSERPKFALHGLAARAEIVLLEAETIVLVVRGACAIRTPSQKLQRVEAGSLLQRAGKRIDHVMQRALRSMQLEPAKAWTVEKLARSLGLSRAAFARRFVAFTGRSPMRYLTELRLGLAASLLENTDAGLAEIASHVGYASEFAFNRAFKRHHGIAPGQFRRDRARMSLAAPTLLAA